MWAMAGLLLAAGPPLPATASGPASAALAPKELVVEKLADGVHALLWTDPLADPIEGNSLVIINREDVVVVDTGLFPSTARRLVAEVKKLTPLPVRYVIHTHWHDDHTNGNQVFRETWPAVEFIAHVDTRADLVAKTHDVRDRDLADIEQGLAMYEEWLRTGKDGAGNDIDDARRGRIEARMALHRAAIAEFGTIVNTPPDLTFEQSLTLRRDGRTIEVRWLGRGNTRGDTVILLPKERIAAIGDLVVHPVPFAFGSYYREWIATLARVDSLPADVLVPGHGPVYRDRAYLRQVQELLRALVARVHDAAATGASLEDTKARVTLEDWKQRFAGDDAGKQRAFESFFLAPAVERAWHQESGDPDE
jgi:glyoxylase-like metal-dependent hydrolase (beta-lactamase superfamily II)